MAALSSETVLARYRRARERRSAWEGLWQECYDFALPTRDTAVRASTAGPRRWDRIFDGTAPDAVDQLAVPRHRCLGRTGGGPACRQHDGATDSALDPVDGLRRRP